MNMRVRLYSVLGATALAATAFAQAPAGYELAFVDFKGNKDVLGTLPPSVFAPRVSPDGTQVVFEIDNAVTEGATTATTQLWVAPLDDISKRRALPLVGTARNIAGVWTPDGKRIVFMVTGMVATDGTPVPDSLWWRNADGSGEAEKLLDGRAPEGFYENGNKLMYIVLGANRDYGIWSLDLTTRQAAKLIDGTGSEQHSSRVSPDGKWIAYVSNDSGRYEVYVEPMPLTGKRYKISGEGGRHPVWSSDGLKLYYDQGGKMYKVDLFLDENPPQSGEAEVLPIQGFQQIDLRRQFELMPEEPRFLMMFPVAR